MFSPFRASFTAAVLWFALMSAAASAPLVPLPTGMALVPAGRYAPLFRGPSDSNLVEVASFYLDVLPVTNEEFLDFVRQNPRWQRSQVKPIFAEKDYLKLWAGDLQLGTNCNAKAPVTYVSWFAAKAYASWKGKRLSTTAEWEYAAAASPSRPDGQRDPAFLNEIRVWYASPSPETLPAVGQTRSNYFGIHDLHGLVWEWVADFNTAMVTGDARGDMGLDRQLFCGSGSEGAKDRGDFPAFMRYGFRSSLKARYTVHNLGFRCAKNL